MSHIKHVPIPWDDFLSLEDVNPSTYTAQAGKFVRVDSDPDGLEFTDDVVQKTGSTMTSFLTLHAAPTSDLHAATKGYVDGVAQGLDVKGSCVVASTGSLTLTNEQTIDGVGVVAGDRVLVKDQGTGSPHADNGIYVCVDAGAWTRSPDTDESDEVSSGMFTFIEEGTANGDTGWVLTTNDPITVGTTAVEFTQFSGAGAYTGGEGITVTGTSIAATWETSTSNIKPLGAVAVGSATNVAHSDHVHAHGDAAGGSLHADVIAAGADGFMTGADKTKLDNIDTAAEVNQFAFSNVDVDAATTVLAAEAKTDTLYVTGGTLITLTGTEGTDTLNFAVSNATGANEILLTGTTPFTPVYTGHVFTAMTDTPANYTSSDNYRLKVDGTTVEFVDDTISNLNDVPTLVADAFAVVNGAGNAVTFVPATSTQGDMMYFNGTTWAAIAAATADYVLTTHGAGTDPTWATNPAGVTTFVALSDVDEADYTGHGGWLVRVNSAPDGLEFVNELGVAAGSTTGNTLYWNGSAWTQTGIIFNDHSNAEVGINTQTPNATLHVNGSISAKVITETGDYDLDTGTQSDVYTILHNNTGADNSITLPTVATYPDRVYNIKKISGPTYTTTILTTGAENIDGAASYVLDQQYESVTVVSDGSNWFIV